MDIHLKKYEAYDNDEDLAYLDKRKPYAWLDYL